jgi:hypothetical protein
MSSPLHIQITPDPGEETDPHDSIIQSLDIELMPETNHTQHGETSMAGSLEST